MIAGLRWAIHRSRCALPCSHTPSSHHRQRHCTSSRALRSLTGSWRGRRAGFSYLKYVLPVSHCTGHRNRRVRRTNAGQECGKQPSPAHEDEEDPITPAFACPPIFGRNALYDEAARIAGPARSCSARRRHEREGTTGKGVSIFNVLDHHNPTVSKDFRREGQATRATMARPNARLLYLRAH